MKAKMKKFLSVAAAVMIGLTAGLTAPVRMETTVSAASLSEIQAKKKEVQKNLDEANANLKEIEGKMNEEAAYQQQLSYQISLNQQKINLLNEQITALTDSIAEKEELIEEKKQEIIDKEAEIEQKQGEIDQTYELFKVRMRSLYMAGETSSLEMLFSSESFADFLTNVELMKAVSQSDNQLVDNLRAQKSEQEEQKAELVEIKAQEEEALAGIEQDKEDIILQRENIKATQSELEAAYAKSKTAQQDYEALQEQYKSNKSAVLAEEKAVEAELQAWYAAQAAQSSGTANSQFCWPLPGYTYVSSGYGSRWGGFHTGMDITGGGVYGANIVAAESGTVILAASHYSYGNYVIIDHGGGYTTLYAHASSILVSVGQQVSRGQAIAKVGSTGNSTGPHLHFEVRINGAHKNPAGYVHP
ncbi:MAG: peptidoglycan DD-metalloendopeptidase family protein [Oscillospiraceae bacterium]|nr:peptidoglycan DD-metalloendopeptidase family protein [Oscillospiraceae bacterium]